MTMNYPTSFRDIAAWAKANSRPVSEARIRYAQYLVLWAIGGSSSLQAAIVFKGGNALDFVWNPNRSTRDLDFSADMSTYDTTLGVSGLRYILDQALRSAADEFDATLAVQHLEQRPKKEGSRFITYQVTIGYALQDELKLQTRMRQGQASTNIIPVEISLNEPICADTEVFFDETRGLRVSTLEDIVAEKLRALLQQQEALRNRNRPQDLLDIATIVRQQRPLDLDRVAEFLLIKAKARDVPVSREAFRRAEIAERARHGYEPLAQTTRNVFIPFDEALTLVLELVDQLPIPESNPG